MKKMKEKAISNLWNIALNEKIYWNLKCHVAIKISF